MSETLSWDVLFSAQAQKDLVDIYNDLLAYTEEENIALRVVRKLRERALSLCNFPYSHRIVFTANNTGITVDIRSVSSGAYIALYSIDDAVHAVYVLRFAYSKRDLPTIELD